MRNLIILIGSFLLLLAAAACGNNAPETAVSPQPESAVEVETENEVQAAATQPQLIEFYADW